MRIAFFMGSFDPIHIGHLNMIRLALKSGLIDKVIVVPSGHNPWKENEPAPFNLRVKMIEEAIKPFGNKCSVSAIEGLFDPPYYANKPLNYFREKYQEDVLFILCGSDTVDKIPKWKNSETDIMPYYSVIEIHRGDVKHESNYKIGETNVFIVDGISLDVSSTEIREDIKYGNCNLYPLLPECVIRIINENNLYR